MGVVMKLSIALATYNGEAFLEAQLRSLLYQTRLPDEVVVSDDCSEDATLHILEAFAREAPFEVLLLRNAAKLGFVRNFERAIEACTGDVIFLSDQDDVWFSEKVSVVEQAFTKNSDSMVVIHDQQITDAQLRFTGNTLWSNY